MKYNSIEQKRGREQCEADIAAGNMQLYWQVRSAWGRFATDLMRRRFDVTVVYWSSFRNFEEISFKSAYNDRIAEYINHTYGSGAYDKAVVEVETYRRTRYEEWLKKRGDNADETR